MRMEQSIRSSAATRGAVTQTRSKAVTCNFGIPLQQRVLSGGAAAGWRAPLFVSDRPLPTFYLHETGGANFKRVRSGLREHVGKRHDTTGAVRLAEEALPIAFSQYLVDVPLIAALETHPSRVYDPTNASWHVLGATPFASRFLALLEQNVTADGGKCCASNGTCAACGAVALAPHRARLNALQRYLEGDRWWRTPGTPFVLLTTGILITNDLSSKLIAELRQRNEKVGPVLLGGVDRSGGHSRDVSTQQLVKRMVILPHVATPECAWHASVCRSSHAPRVRTSTTASTAEGSPVSAAAAAASYGCRLEPASPKGSRRVGLLFHGDTGRFDNGARGAVRDIGPHLRSPHSFQGLRLMNKGSTTNRHDAHAIHRIVSRHTTRAMLDANLCFAPQGDTDTSRRLFDAIATGCVPVIMRVAGGRPAQTMLSNLPFHHSIEWRALAHFLSPAYAKLEDREKVHTDDHVASCRRDEAALVEEWNQDESTTMRMRRAAIHAFRAHLDVELHPRGVADAFLRELAYALTDVPASLFLPPPHLLPPGMREWGNMSRFQWLWK